MKPPISVVPKGLCIRCRAAPIVHPKKICDECRGKPQPCPTAGCPRYRIKGGTYCRPCFEERWAKLPKNPLKQRRRTLRQYGLTLEDFAALLAAQGGGCAGCGATESTAVLSNQYGAKGNLHVDHCHATGENRGILCASCNAALGRVKDNPEILRALADYLEDPPARKVL